MLEIHWLALGVFATICLFLWLVVIPNKRVYATAGLSGVAYGMMALSAPGVEKVVQGGEIVSAPVSQSVQFFVGFLGLLSFLVVYLHRHGEYPPEATNESRK